MSDENIVHVMPDTSPAQQNNANDGERNSTGKIARLPYKIREQLNRRLRNNEPESEILPWLNELPSTKRVLTRQFDGKPINSQNLSNWRRGGHQQWMQRQESVDEIQGLVEDAKDFARVADGNLTRGTASVAAAKILKMLHQIPPGQGSVNDLTKISFAIGALLNADQNQVRLEHEETRLFQGNERLVLSWDKFLRDRVETAQRALNDTICKDIQAADIDNGEKIELLGHELFGKKWQGREVGKKEDKKDATKGPESPKKDAAGSTEVKKMEAQMADQQAHPTTVQGHSTEARVSSGKKLSTPKPKAPAAELSPDKKAMREGQTSLAAQDASFTPAENPKPQADQQHPKPSPWDAFSEPVRVSPFASLRGPLLPTAKL